MIAKELFEQYLTLTDREKLRFGLMINRFKVIEKQKRKEEIIKLFNDFKNDENLSALRNEWIEEHILKING